MEMNFWIWVLLGLLSIVLVGVLVFLKKHKKTIHFYSFLIILLILAAIFFHGVSFQLH
ncbi:Uncharacterised protein [Legionella bozemanae]|uniref:Uncharacterized protein n=2 Tax=Legionellaceae TaxID=444 RepID=A0A377IW99_9GAMM|nr:hypothetical protein Lboz_3336 [Legionella bozemanae]STO32916.1 Uncharacterised protein [Legionella bozemanae]STO91722.1 Uncharacterised protein [Fluoribacter dumoffii]STP13953.1 Uncharacterised protein [Legionella bozemanae]